MRKIYCVLLIAVVSLPGCHSGNQKTANSITGIYTKKINNEFAKGVDSLIVTVLDKDAGTYSVAKNYGFMRYLDGQKKRP